MRKQVFINKYFDVTSMRSLTSFACINTILEIVELSLVERVSIYFDFLRDDRNRASSRLALLHSRDPVELICLEKVPLSRLYLPSASLCTVSIRSG
jgi:hypothetical protein